MCTLLVGDTLIGVGRPGPIQSTSSVQKACLVGHIAGRDEVFLRNNRLLGARLRVQAFQISGPPSLDPSDVSID